jgi:hypothetical protein
MIAVGVDRRRAARFDRVGDAVFVAVGVDEVAGAVLVVVFVGLDQVGDRVGVAV